MDRLTEKILRIIVSRPGEVRQSELWKLLGIDHRACSRIVRRLAEDGFIRRSEVSMDGIIRTYLLTPALPIGSSRWEGIISAYRDIHGSPGPKTLVRNHRLISSERVVKHTDNPGHGPYRILARPLREILVDDLRKGCCSFRDLADRHGIAKRDAQDEIESLICSGHLLEQGYVIGRSGHRRRTKTKGSEYVYSLIPVPAKVRIFDPFLGFSLLDWTRFLALPGREPPLIPANEVIAEYRDLIHAAFGMSYPAIDATLSRNPCIFFGSAFGPVPVLARSSDYSELFSLLTGKDSMALQVPYSDAGMERKIRETETFLRHSPDNLPEIQKHVLALSEMLRSCRKEEKHRLLGRLESLNEQFFRTLFHTESRMHGQPPDGNTVGMTGIIIPDTIGGSGDRDIRFEAPSAMTVINADYTGTGRFLLLRRTGPATALIHATAEPGSYSVMLKAKRGQLCSLAVRATGSWTLRLGSLSPETAEKLPLRILGKDRQVTGPFVLTPGEKVFSASHYGPGPVVVRLSTTRSPAAGPVFSGRGPQDFNGILRIDRLCIGWLDVHARGNWRIGIEDKKQVDPDG